LSKTAFACAQAQALSLFVVQMHRQAGVRKATMTRSEVWLN
jgi:hypothetical protein